MKKQPAVVIVGGGPVGLVLALMLARREIASEVLDARALEAAQADRRLLALSRGTLQLLRPLADLPPAVTAPIRRVHVSSAGEFGRVELGNDDGERGSTRPHDPLRRPAGTARRGLQPQRTGDRLPATPGHGDPPAARASRGAAG